MNLHPTPLLTIAALTVAIAALVTLADGAAPRGHSAPAHLPKIGLAWRAVQLPTLPAGLIELPLCDTPDSTGPCIWDAIGGGYGVSHINY